MTPADVVTVYYDVGEEKSNVAKVFESFRKEVEAYTRVTVLPLKFKAQEMGTITDTVADVSLFLSLLSPRRVARVLFI